VTTILTPVHGDGTYQQVTLWPSGGGDIGYNVRGHNEGTAVGMWSRDQVEAVYAALGQLLGKE
jgi:hypothetical protein